MGVRREAGVCWVRYQWFVPWFRASGGATVAIAPITIVTTVARSQRFTGQDWHSATRTAFQVTPGERSAPGTVDQRIAGAPH
ncbi:hypothetical protein TUSST3_70650 [Streptomyces sp. TUS-ST3]|nr:hypothetical protein TUSST3_70650 [Streptomyces sp. TUS-ST3]